MPIVHANDIDINYEVQGDGEPMVLIPYLAADQACYAFQVAEYAKHFTCFSVDLRGAGLSSKPDGTYTTELLADDVAAFMQAAGIGSAHIFGLSLGAATGMWLAAKHPPLVKSLSLHSAWPNSDPFLRGGSRGLADYAPRPGQRDRDGDQGNLPLVLHPRAVRRPARVHRFAR
jgi:3-oxoadipate enol-lactonase